MIPLESILICCPTWMKIWSKRGGDMHDDWQGKMVSGKKNTKSGMFFHWLSIYLPSFACPSPFNEPTRQLARIGRQWQKYVNLSLSLLLWHVQEPNSCLECCVYAYRVCVLCTGGEKLHCASLLAYANATRECGSQGSKRSSVFLAAKEVLWQIRRSCRSQF